MPKIVDHDAYRRDIVAVAKAIILEGGFEAATMRSIAARAGFANGALKHYFPSKDSIVAATFESILRELEENISAIDRAEDEGKLRGFLAAPLPRTVDAVASGRVLLALWEYAMSSPDLAALYRRHLERWRQNVVDHLTAARASGTIRLDPPYEPLADEYIAVVIGATVVHLMYPDGDRIPAFDGYLDGLMRRLQ